MRCVLLATWGALRARDVLEGRNRNLNSGPQALMDPSDPGKRGTNVERDSPKPGN
jgi:hypothetical protein